MQGVFSIVRLLLDFHNHYFSPSWSSKFSKGARGADDDVGASARRRLHHPVNTKLPINWNLHAKREVELDRSIQICVFTNMYK